MARTRASVAAKVTSVKSSKAKRSVAPPSSGSSSGKRKSSRWSGRGNPVCPRPTPEWQKPITMFFFPKSDDSSQKSDGEGEADGASNPKSKKLNTKESSDDTTKENSKNNEKPDQITPSTELDDSIIYESGSCSYISDSEDLDDTFEPEPLTGENSRKIEEYYSKLDKGKGSGKKTKEIKNVNNDIESEKEVVVNKDGELDDLNKSCDNFNKEKINQDNKITKGKGKGKKTKLTKNTISNSKAVEGDVSQAKENLKKNTSKQTDESTKKGSNNEVDSSMDTQNEKNQKEDKNTVERKKREREEILDEEAVNISKKIKVDQK